MTDEQHNASRKHVLVVDDTPDNLAVLGGLLMPHYNVRVANSGAWALTSANTEPRPDIILLDIMMPEMDGYEVLKQLKANPETRDIPVVFITAMDAPEDEARGLALGAMDYITKPISPAIVLARVRAQLDLKAARDILRDHNAWLESEIQRRIHQFEKIQNVTIRALASLAEAKDNETGNHILRTQNYVNALAIELAGLPQYADKLTPEAIAMMTKAAPLHDIGKVGIPDAILNKPGKHDPEEWEIMKTHAQLGADAIWRAIRDEEDIESVRFLHVAMEIAGNHHEKWDGSGYPNGLSGEQIPLSARLMALADVFDALISKRVYKPAYPLETARAIILENRGKHFDPQVVDAFEQCIDTFQAIAASHADAEMAI